MTSHQFKVLIVCAALVVSACVPKPDSTPVALDAPEVSCAAEAYRNLIGQQADAAVAIPNPKRFIAPNSAVTMDHSPSRTNVMLDDKGRISDLTCG